MTSRMPRRAPRVPRSVTASLLSTALLAPPALALDTAVSGLVTIGCERMVDDEMNDAALVAFKLGADPLPDVHVAQDRIGGTTTGGSVLESDGSWGLPGNWRTLMNPGDAIAVFVTRPGAVAVDSGEVGQASGGDFGLTAFQSVGAMDDDAPRVTPVPGGFVVSFRPIRELDAAGAGGACGVGGSPLHGRRLVIGYNVYRLPADEWPAPSLADFREHGYLLHAPVAETTSGSVAPPSRLAGSVSLEDPDGVLDTGDEVVHVRDVAGPADASWPPPEPGRNHWYRVQPVIAGRVADFLVTGTSNRNLPSLVSDADGDGVLDAVDIAGDGLVDFADPSENGLGLLHAGEILSSRRAGLGRSLAEVHDRLRQHVGRSGSRLPDGGDEQVPHALRAAHPRGR